MSLYIYEFSIICNLIYLRFVILACDGLWKSFKNEEAVEFVKKNINVKSEVVYYFYEGAFKELFIIYKFKLIGKNNSRKKHL